MFETSVVQAQAKAGGSRLRLLTVSVLAHSAIIIGIVATSIASVEFPANAPDESAAAPLFVQVRIPPPLGNPDGGAKPQKPAQPAPQKPATPVNQITAPQDVPQTIPTLEPPSNGTTTGPSTSEGTGTGTQPGPVGVPWGEEDGVGELDGPPITTTIAPVEEKIYQAHEVKAPVKIFTPAPQYPQILTKTRMRATVVVRCVIDRNGNVRDAQIIVPASMPPFNDAVLRTVQTWRFQPGSFNGKAVDSYLNLTVHFAVN